MATETGQANQACVFCGKRDADLITVRGVEGDHALCPADKRRLDGVVAAVQNWLNWPDTVTRERALDLLRTSLEPTGIDVADRV